MAKENINLSMRFMFDDITTISFKDKCKSHRIKTNKLKQKITYIGKLLKKYPDKIGSVNVLCATIKKRFKYNIHLCTIRKTSTLLLSHHIRKNNNPKGHKYRCKNISYLYNQLRNEYTLLCGDSNTNNNHNNNTGGYSSMSQNEIAFTERMNNMVRERIRRNVIRTRNRAPSFVNSIARDIDRASTTLETTDASNSDLIPHEAQRG